MCQGSYVFAQSNYSSAAIQIYNSGVAFHKQGKYDIAEQKYNQALKIQPNFVEARKNLAILYRNKAQKCLSSEDYNNAILYAQKALPFNYKRKESYHIIANCYRKQEDYGNAIIAYQNILAIDPNDDMIMDALAYSYLKVNQAEKSQEIYKKVLLINPNDKEAQQNLKYANFQHTDKLLTQSLNNLKIEEKAPNKIYRLIKPDRDISEDSVESMKTVLDLIWSEPSGRMMLEALEENKVQIKIINSDVKATTYHRSETTNYGGYTTSTYLTAVNIPVKYIYNFNNTNLPAYSRVYNLQVFVHEFGHAYMFINDPDNKDSIEEEVGVSMLGYNLANKVLTGEYLSREQAHDYGVNCLQGALTDEHKDLPVFGGFNLKIRRFGINMPYPEEYSALPAMYQKLLSENKITPVQSFSPYVR